jgi:arylsulfatase A-like enzyme
LPAAVKGTHTTTEVLMHAIDILPTIVSAANGADAWHALAMAQAQEGKALDGMDMWGAISTGAAAGPRTELLLEADPHSLPLEKEYCGDQHGQGPGTGYYAVRRNQWKLILGDPAGGDGDGWHCTGAPCPWRGWNETQGSNPSPLNATSIQLYDVVADKEEKYDKAATEPAVVAELLAAIKKYNDSAVPSFICGKRGKCVIDAAITPFDGIADGQGKAHY